MSNPAAKDQSIPDWKPIATAPQNRSILIARYCNGRTYVEFVEKDENDYTWTAPDTASMACGIDVPYAWAPAPKPPVFRKMVSKGKAR